MKRLVKLVNKKKLKIIGLMSGTSCDGVDLALTEITGAGTKTRVDLLDTYHQHYSPQQKKELLLLLEPGFADLKSVSQVNFYLAGIWAESIVRLLKKAGMRRGDIDLIGSHGHTFYHQPLPEVFIDRKTASTFQVGDPAVLAHLTGITTVGDFRNADVALGGQGAPLVPYVDWLMFSGLKRNLLVLNIGGIANFTFIPDSGKKEEVQAFDTGPGNMLIDQLMQRLYEKPFDKNGTIAARGSFSEKLFNLLKKSDPFPNIPPPKSTGREHYGKDFIIPLLKKSLRWRITEPDILHTVSKYTAYTIRIAAAKFISQPISEIIVGGGGCHNRFLMNALAAEFPETVLKKSGEIGLNEDFKEAVCFAVLAYELIRGEMTNLPAVTGADRPAFLGKICPA
jgi:anhydro-N-acetylmuramic acid kinase